MPPVIRNIFMTSVLIMAVSICCPTRSSAVQWLSLTETSRYKVAYDDDSVKLTSLGRLAVWMRFTPKGELQRKASAGDYEEKGYRSHLEHYEVDCSERSAVLLLIDVLGESGNRLKRMKGGTKPETIIRGSALDKAYEMICQTIEDEVYEEEPIAPDSENSGQEENSADKKLTNEVRQLIETLARKTRDEPANIDAWRLLGNAYFDADMPEPAIEAYNQALAINPNDTDILNDQGAMFRQKGEFNKALSNFDKAFKTDPKNLESLYNSGFVQAFDLNNIPKALELWKFYLTLDNSSEMAGQVKSHIERFQNENKQTLPEK